MTFILQAPVPSIQATTILPSPQFSDGQGKKISVDVKRAMDGELYTYVKSNNRQKLQYQFLISRLKALELRAFIQSYYRNKVRLTTHRGEVWEAYFTSSPFEFDTVSGPGDPGEASVNITLEFEGEQIVSVSPSECE